MGKGIDMLVWEFIFNRNEISNPQKTQTCLWKRRGRCREENELEAEEEEISTEFISPNRRDSSSGVRHGTPAR